MKKFVVYLWVLCAPLVSFANQDPFESLWQESLTAYELYGNEQYTIQEEITQINHVLQAASLARLAGAPSFVVVALLFHDIGQVIREENIGRIEILHSDHAEIGGEWLEKRGFPKSVSDFVRDHALAKVVLCQMEPSYFASLSQASQNSYFIQKQKYEQNPDRIAAFMNNPLREHYLAARKCDDMSKLIALSVENGNLLSFDCYQLLASRVYQGEDDAGFEDWIETVNTWHRQMIDSSKAFEKMIVKLLPR